MQSLLDKILTFTDEAMVKADKLTQEKVKLSEALFAKEASAIEKEVKKTISKDYDQTAFAVLELENRCNDLHKQILEMDAKRQALAQNYQALVVRVLEFMKDKKVDKLEGKTFLMAEQKDEAGNKKLAIARLVEKAKGLKKSKRPSDSN